MPIGVPAQTATGTISGQLLTREGQPAVGVRISVTPVPEAGTSITNSTSLLSIAPTDSAGRYRLENSARPVLRDGGIRGLPDVLPWRDDAERGYARNFTTVIPAGVSVKGRVVGMSTLMTTVQRVTLRGTGTPPQDTSITSDGAFEFARVRKLMNGQPIPVLTTVTVNFTFQ